MKLEKVLEWGKYLPSKKFSIIIGSCTGGLLLIFIISSLFGNHTLFDKNPTSTHLIASNGTLNEAIARDSNKNGIPDWEESLWGLDPKGDGAQNKSIIDAKKASGAIQSTDDSDPTATDAFSRELLSAILTLRQSGTLTPEALQKVASSVADGVDTKHTNAFTYSMHDMTIATGDQEQAKNTYETSLKKLIARYNEDDFGSELTIISDALQSENKAEVKQLLPIANAYTDFGARLVKIKTPRSIAQNALDLANASAQMGESLKRVANLYSDTIVGMVALDDYVIANDASDRATTTIMAYFAN